MKADKIILWLGKEQFPNREKDLPVELLNLTNEGLTIKWCKDIKSYKKLIPALAEYPDYIIVTADDDILYDENMLKELYDAYTQNPEFIQCHRAHYIVFDKKLLPYNKWRWNITKTKPSFNIFFTGVGGVLYPPKCFYKDILREDLFMSLCPSNDDIWFWAMCVLNNRKINIVKGKPKLKYIDKSQEVSLYHQNVLNGQNDVQLENVFKYYKKLSYKIEKINYLYNNNLEKLFSIKKVGEKKIYTILGIRIKIKSSK